MISPGRVDDGQWHMAAYTSGSEDTGRMYIDGALVAASEKLDQAMDVITSDPGVELDEIALFDHALTPEQIRGLAVAGGLQPGEDLNLVAVPTALEANQVAPTDLYLGVSLTGPEVHYGDTMIWDFGDGTTATTLEAEATPGMRVTVHEFPAPGTYNVTVRHKSLGEVSAPFTQTVQVAPLVAGSDFVRFRNRNLNYVYFGCGPFFWGSSQGQIDVEGNATLTEPGRQDPTLCLRELTDFDARVEIRMGLEQDNISGGGTVAEFIAHDSDAGRYVARLVATAYGTTDLFLVRVLNGEEKVLDRFSPGVNGTYSLRFAVAGVDGGTSLNAKAWPAGTNEPEAWTLSTVDLEPALAHQGKYGLGANLSATSTKPDTVRFGSLRVMSTSPTASFTAVPDGRTVAFDASTSIALAGRTITGYQWSLDGVPAEGPTVTHRFTSGTHPVTLTVTDSEGESSTLVKNVTVGASAPVAAFTSGVDGLTATFDASTSTATDDPIDTYTWDFGDGTTGTGAKPSHTYREPGVYPVTLTVDAAGLTGTVTHQVTVTEAALADTFSRTAANGWGTSSSSITWLTASDMRSTQAVGGGVGTMTLDKPARLSTARADGLVLGNVDATVDVVVNKVSAGRVHVSQELWRQVDSTGALTGLYRAKAVFYPDGSVEVSLVDERGGTETFIASTRAGFTYAPGDVARFRVRAVAGSDGTATLQAKVWKAGTSEPDWQATATPQRPKVGGGYALASYLTSGATAGGVRVSFDNLNVLRLAG